MGILDNAKSMAEKVKENAPAILGKVEDQVEKLEGKGGTVGKLATSGHKVIDSLQEKLPGAKPGDAPTDTASADTSSADTSSSGTSAATPPATAAPPTATFPPPATAPGAGPTEDPATVAGADPEGPTEFGNTAE